MEGTINKQFFYDYCVFRVQLYGCNMQRQFGPINVVNYLSDTAPLREASGIAITAATVRKAVSTTWNASLASISRLLSRGLIKQDVRPGGYIQPKANSSANNHTTSVPIDDWRHLAMSYRTNVELDYNTDFAHYLKPSDYLKALVQYIINRDPTLLIPGLYSDLSGRYSTLASVLSGEPVRNQTSDSPDGTTSYRVMLQAVDQEAIAAIVAYNYTRYLSNNYGGIPDAAWLNELGAGNTIMSLYPKSIVNNPIISGVEYAISSQLATIDEPIAKKVLQETLEYKVAVGYTKAVTFAVANRIMDAISDDLIMGWINKVGRSIEDAIPFSALIPNIRLSIPPQS